MQAEPALNDAERDHAARLRIGRVVWGALSLLGAGLFGGLVALVFVVTHFTKPSPLAWASLFGPFGLGLAGLIWITYPRWRLDAERAQSERTPSPQAAAAARLRRRRVRRIIALGLPSILLFSVLGALSSFAVRAHARGAPSGGFVAALVIIGALALVGLGATLWLARDLAKADKARSPFSRADELQRMRARGLLAFGPIALMITPGLWRSAGGLIEGERLTINSLMGAAICLLALINLVNVLGLGFRGQAKAVFDDELSRHLRARAVYVGFLVLFCGAAGLFALGVLTAPALAVQAMPLLILYTAVAVSVSYAVMELRAARDD